MSSFGIYLTGIFYIYLDLYLSLKRMSISKPVISVRTALIMTALSWIGNFAFCASGYGMNIPTYQYREESDCILTKGLYKKQYILLITIAFLSGLGGILFLQVITYRLMKRTQKRLLSQHNLNKVAAPNASSDTNTLKDKHVPQERKTSQKMEWLKKNDAVMKIIFIILIFFCISWYPLIISVLIVIYCESCSYFITQYLWKVSYFLVICQYNLSGIVYMSKLKDFRNSCTGVCCKCIRRRRSIQPANSDTERSTRNF
ncbi:hypothetical protein LSH36_44g07035 [Paralvinella palmiformis]|uniref:G-protein coupled receptors family 1 profile domain-containing protein n=1 Tax=Paralvinella palmiformis TaxID=53620 RepID=A0AAD9NF19_9ANNE|nr:hypothetical protein LSH36_44g07035 [Paralvinella palmiformis]